MRKLFYFRQFFFAMLAPITALAAPYSVEVLADNPVAFYRLNETPGATIALDASPNGNHATYAGTVLPTLGVSSGASSGRQVLRTCRSQHFSNFSDAANPRARTLLLAAIPEVRLDVFN